MNFYVIANGYGSDGYCRVYVSAKDENRAKELASQVFKNESDKRYLPYPKAYYNVNNMPIEYTLDGSSEGFINEVDS